MRIDRLYAAALDPSLWTDSIDLVRQLLKSSSSLWFTPTTPPGVSGGMWIGRGLDPASLERYQAHYYQTDPWERGFFGHRVASDCIRTGDELVARGIFERSEWFNDFLRGYDIYHLMSAILDKPGQMFPRFYCSFYRPIGAEGFDERDKRMQAVLLPHLGSIFDGERSRPFSRT